MDGCVVIIDDEEDVAGMLCDLLEMEGFVAMGVSHPNELDEALEACPPGVLLIDIMLPGISGVELASQLRSGRFSETPMIAMSASKLMTRVARESRLFQECFEKPFETSVLLGRLKDLFASRNRHDTAAALSHPVAP